MPFVMQTSLLRATFALTGALLTSPIWAAPCGTIAAPTACTVVAGNVTFTFSSFALSNAGASGGATLYGAGDVAIDVSTGGGTTGLLTFAKPAGAPSSVYFANSGGESHFTITYQVTISPAAPGTVEFDPLAVVNFGPSSALGNGVAAAQMIPETTPGTSCQVVRNVNGVTPGNCSLPPSQPLTLDVGDIVQLNGGQGASNVSFASITNLISALHSGAPPTVGASKVSSLVTDLNGNGQANPGDTVGYLVTLGNTGDGDANAVQFQDAPDPNTTLVVGSVTTTQGTVTTGNTAGDGAIAVNLGTLAPASAVAVGYHVTIDDPLPAGVTSVVNQGQVLGGNFTTVPTDDPATAQPADATTTPVAGFGVVAIPTLEGAGMAILGLLLAGVATRTLLRRRRTR
jgi:uncharacterized repeat protein (TIGR01451 family)